MLSLPSALPFSGRCWVLYAAVAWLAGCGGGGGGGGGSGAVAPAAPAPAPAPAPAAACTLPSLPARPAATVDVRSFGAVPDDALDDTAAIQAAINSLSDGQWLVFPAGVYRHDRRLTVRTPRAVLWSDGATLHATNPDDQAVMLAADGASLYNFTLTAVTRGRLDAPWQSRIAIFDTVERATRLADNVVQGNRVINGGAPGSQTANSASSAGIYVEFAENFLIADNEIRRSLADGININGGARNGRVLFNTVRESGDDMIGLVSYMGTGNWITSSAASLAASLETQRDRQLVRNVLVAHNDVSGQYSGRGISVVGGADITVRDNRIERTTTGAGIFVARDASFVTWGVNNVRIEDNAVSRVQTDAPAYTPIGWNPAGRVTGHGGVEIYSFVFDDERNDPNLLAALSVQNIRVARTTVTQARFAGVRIGVGTGVADRLTGLDEQRRTVSRALSGGPVGRIDLEQLALDSTAVPALDILTRTSAADNVVCTAVTANGQPIGDLACGGSRPAVSGASQTCAR